jgi:predicted nucleic-acid-binding Zn-ribbon protein
MTWKCNSCSEEHDDSFEACWNCGTSREGHRQTTFVRAQDMTPQDQSVEAAFRSHFRCERCASRQCKVKRIAATGTGVSRLLNLEHNRFISVSCQSCARVELFDLDVLEGRNRLSDVMDLLFGA